VILIHKQRHPRRGACFLGTPEAQMWSAAAGLTSATRANPDYFPAPGRRSPYPGFAEGGAIIYRRRRITGHVSRWDTTCPGFGKPGVPRRLAHSPPRRFTFRTGCNPLKIKRPRADALRPAAWATTFGHRRPRAGGAVTDGQRIGRPDNRHHRPRAGGAVFCNDSSQTEKGMMSWIVSRGMRHDRSADEKHDANGIRD